MFKRGRYRLSVIASLIIEEESKMVRTLNERREMNVDSSGVGVESETKWICTCDIRRSGNGIDDSDCWQICSLKAAHSLWKRSKVFWM